MAHERPPRVERRLAAILAADVAGYSRLMHHGEETTHARLTALLTDAIYPTIAEHGGRIVKNTGDGFLAEFPSAVEAVRAAIRFQIRVGELTIEEQEEARIAFRVGINIGDIIIEPNDIFGDGVNIAVRLESIAIPGGICISGSTCDHVRGKVEVEFIDLGEQVLKNIDHPVRVYSIFPTMPTDRPKPILSSPPPLSIVVLPFTNLGRASDQDPFVDGITENLTTDLSRIRGSFVIGRHTAFKYRDKAIDLATIGRELNIRYVLEGSVQRSGDQMRVNVQLIDARTAHHLWAERFDKPINDLFRMQDEIVSRIANTLKGQLIAAEARRAERAPRPNSLDLYFRGMTLWNKSWAPEHMNEARGYFKSALKLDSNNVDALVGIAAIDMACAGHFIVDDIASRFEAAELALTRALSMAPEHALAHMFLGCVQYCSGRLSQGMAECEYALTLNRNLAEAHSALGAAKLMDGRPAETEAHVEEALRLSPLDEAAHRWMSYVGLAKLHLEANVEAVFWLRRSLKANMNYPLGHFELAAALSLMGELDEARAAAKAGLALDPAFTIRRLRSFPSAGAQKFRAASKRLIQGMRQAGIPEG